MHHKTIFILAILVTIILPSSVSAGALYGTIVDEQGHAVADATVRVTMDGSDKTYDAAAATDASGSYRVVIPEKGRGTLTISDSEGITTIRIYVFQGSVRWNLKRDKTDSGLTLERR